MPAYPRQFIYAFVSARIKKPLPKIIEEAASQWGIAESEVIEQYDSIRMHQYDAYLMRGDLP